MTSIKPRVLLINYAIKKKKKVTDADAQSWILLWRPNVATPQLLEQMQIDVVVTKRDY